VEPVLGVALAAGVLYIRGWRQLSRRMPRRFGPGRLAAFVAGLGAIVLAVASPLDALAGRLLVAHMAQHQLLMMVAPPLLWLSLPVLPLWLGVPRWLGSRAHAAIANGIFRPFGILVEHPITPWLVATLTVLAWHIPTAFEIPWPRGPVVVSTPGVRKCSGWPGVSDSH